jgi:hypothetical protein
MVVIDPVLTVDRIETTETEKPSTPQFSFKNVINEDMKILNITCIPDTSFTFRGAFTIEIGGKTFTDLRWSNMGDVSEINIDFTSLGGAKLDLNEEVEVFLWNDTDSALLAMTVILHCGKVF